MLVDFQGDLKALVCEKLKVVSCQHQLDGWKKEPASSSTVLKSLNLPRSINTLFLKLSTPLVELEAGDSSSEVYVENLI